MRLACAQAPAFRRNLFAYGNPIGFRYTKVNMLYKMMVAKKIRVWL